MSEDELSESSVTRGLRAQQRWRRAIDSQTQSISPSRNTTGEICRSSLAPRASSDLPVATRYKQTHGSSRGPIAVAPAGAYSHFCCGTESVPATLVEICFLLDGSRMDQNHDCPHGQNGESIAMLEKACAKAANGFRIVSKQRYRWMIRTANDRFTGKIDCGNNTNHRDGSTAGIVSPPL